MSLTRKKRMTRALVKRVFAACLLTAVSGAAALACHINGTVYNDADAGTISGPVTNTGGGLYANAVNNSNQVVASATVQADGTYSIALPAGGTYRVVLTTSASSNAPALPTNWVNTNEGTTAAGDGTVNGTVLNVTVCGSCTVNGVNFAIERKPVANNVSAPTQANMELGTRFMVPKLNGNDAEDGVMGAGKTVKILTLPSNATLRYDGVAVTANQVIASYDSTLLTVSPTFTGSGTVVFNYTFIDAASMAGNSACVTMPFGPTGFACDGLLKFTRQVTSGSATNTVLSYPLFNTGTGNFNTTNLTTYSNKAFNGSVYYKGYVYTMTMTPESNVLNELRPDGSTATYTINNLPSSSWNNAGVDRNGIMYMMQPGSFKLFRIDLNTKTLVGSNGGQVCSGINNSASNAIWGDMVVDPSSGEMMVWYHPQSGGNPGLYKLNLSTFNFTLVGAVTQTMGSMMYDGFDRLFGYGGVAPIASNQDRLWLINQTNASTTQVGAPDIVITQSDGTSCPFRISLGLTSNATCVAAGQSFSYTARIANFTDYSPSRVVYSDTLDSRFAFSTSQVASLTTTLQGYYGSAASVSIGSANGGTNNVITINGLKIQNLTNYTFNIAAQANAGATFTDGEVINNYSYISNIPGYNGGVERSSDHNSGTAQSPASFKMFVQPTVSISGSATSCSATLTATPGTAASYQWAMGGSNISGATSSSYTTSTPGTYTVTVVNGGGCSSTATGTLNPCLSGTVYNDVNGITDNQLNGTGTNAGGLYATLVNGTTAVRTVSVGSTGAYAFSNVPAGSYTVVISTTNYAAGATNVTASLPATWVNTSEAIATAYNDGTIDGKLAVTVGSSSVSGANFGIEQTPVAGGGVNSALNPGGTTQVTVPANTFSNTTASSDPTPGAVTGIRITAFPTGATSIVINGTTYTSANAAALTALIIPTNASGQPTWTITVDPTAAGATSVTIPFVSRDAANRESANGGNAVMNFTSIAISGTVRNDADGGTISGTGIGTATGTQLYVNLVNPATNVVIASRTLGANGTYSFTSADGVMPNTGYSVVLTTSATAAGATLPSGWMNTAEGDNGTAGDGTVNGVQNVSVITSDVVNKDFGIQQPPVAGSGSNSALNPGGTTQVTVPASTFTNTTASSDAAPGNVASIRITAFPTGTTSIVINGVTYTTANAAALIALVIPTDANGNPTWAITVDPTVAGATSVTIPFKSRDNAGAESANTGNAVMNFTSVMISGTVRNDADGGTISGTGIGTASGTQLYVNLVNNTTNVVIASRTLGTNGTYSFTSADGVLPNTTYKVVLTTSATAAGATLPASWMNTAEGDNGTAGDGTVNGVQTVSVVTSDVMNKDFGIQQPPVAGSGSNSALNPGGTTQVTVPASTFTNTTASSDAAPGNVASIRITAFPTGATSIVINGVTYTTANAAALTALVIPTDANGNPTWSITVDPTAVGAGSVTIPFKSRDNAGAESANTGNAVMNFTSVMISGTVRNDADGGTISGTGIGTASGTQLYVNLVNNTTNVVIASRTLGTNGTYSFTSADGVLPNTTYKVVLTTSATAAGATLPSGWMNTAEGDNGTAGDGTVNGVQTVSVVTSDVMNKDFGIQQPPVAGSGSNSALNPGGTTQVTVPASTFTNTTASSDAAPGNVASIRITAFPTGATSIVINGVTYTTANAAALTALVIPTDANGNPTWSITVDPTATGAGSVTIPFKSRDNAGAESANTGNAVMNFTSVAISGTVRNDADGGTISGTGIGTASGTQLYVNLVNPATNTVIASRTLGADGSYNFTSADGVTPNTTYSVVLTTSATAAGATLPSGWMNTAEGDNSTIGDGTVNGAQTVIVVTSDVVNKDFGIQQPPVAGSGSNTTVNPGGLTQATVPASTFTNTTVSSDATPGNVSGIRITSFPTGATSIVVNGVTYTTATASVLTALVIPTDANGNPTWTITVDPTAAGATSVTIPFKSRDNAGAESANTGNAVMNFTSVAISGTVRNDADGGTISGTGIGTASGTQLYVNLVNNTTNVVIASRTLGADGTYSFTSIDGVTPNTTYSVVLTTSATAAGATLPSGWMNTAEGDNGTAGDGTVNGVQTVSVVTSDVMNKDFGIQQPPVAGSGSNSTLNPGGTTQVTVPASTFTNTTASSDAAPGNVASIRITAFPTGATSIVINGVTYTTANAAALTALVIPTDANGNPTWTITVDPTAVGAGSVTIPFKSRDNAGAESANTGSAVLNMTDVTISGTIYDDANGTTDMALNGTPTNVIGSNTLYVSLVSNGVTIATQPVAANGTYTFTSADGVLPNTTYTIVVSNANGAVIRGAVNTSEAIAPAYTDGTADGSLTVAVGSSNVANANFGINLLPEPGIATDAERLNPGGTISSLVSPGIFSGTDADGTVTAININAFPSNATSITVNGVTYTASSPVWTSGGITIPATASGQPLQAISIDPTEGVGTVTIPYVVIDNGGAVSTTGYAFVPFTLGSISGNVFEDTNGDGLVNGTGTNLGGPLYAVLRETTSGNVFQTVPVAVDGTYAFTGLSANAYSVTIYSDTTVSYSNLPNGYGFNGEAIGLIMDPIVDGVQNMSINNVTMFITDVNFGAQLLDIETRMQESNAGTINTGNGVDQSTANGSTVNQTATIRNNSGLQAATAAEMSATLAPNPAATGANVRVSMQGRNGESVRAIVTNMAGQVIYQSSAVNADVIEVPTSGLAAGMYQVSIACGNQTRSLRLQVK